MGLFSFIKDAGAKLFGKEDEAPAKTETAAPAAAPTMVADERNHAKEAKLGEYLGQLELSIDSLDIQYFNSDGVVIIGGTAPSQAVREKAIIAVGNVNGVTSVEDNIEVEAPEPEAQFHTVESGDTLSGISKKYYGTWKNYPQIFEANKPMLQDVDKIYPGQVLRIPVLAD